MPSYSSFRAKQDARRPNISCSTIAQTKPPRSHGGARGVHARCSLRHRRRRRLLRCAPGFDRRRCRVHRARRASCRDAPFGAARHERARRHARSSPLKPRIRLRRPVRSMRCLLGVKTWQVPAAADALEPLLGADTFVVPLQNGVDTAEVLARKIGARARRRRNVRRLLLHRGARPHPAHRRHHVHQVRRARRRGIGASRTAARSVRARRLSRWKCPPISTSRCGRS